MTFEEYIARKEAEALENPVLGYNRMGNSTLARGARTMGQAWVVWNKTIYKNSVYAVKNLLKCNVVEFFGILLQLLFIVATYPATSIILSLLDRREARKDLYNEYATCLIINSRGNNRNY